MGERKKGLLYDLDCLVGTLFAVIWVLEMVLFKGSLEYIVVLIHFISTKLFKWDFEAVYKNELLRIRFLFEYTIFTFMQDILRISVQVDHRDTEHKNAPAVYIPTHAGFLDMILNSSKMFLPRNSLL